MGRHKSANSTHDQRIRLVSAIVGGSSIADAAERVGITYGAAKMIARAAGVRSRIRVSPVVRSLVIDADRRGVNRNVIAEVCGLPRDTVDMICLRAGRIIRKKK